MISIKNLNIKYGKRTILEDINISFLPGTISIIKGSSGSGKSSLLNVIGLIQNPNVECEYYLNGRKISFEDENEKARHRLNSIGFVFQQNNLISWLNAYDNIIVPAKLECATQRVDEKIQKWLKYVNLEEVADNFPSELSGGEEQRVAIARALVNDCDVILADEPTASLDKNNREKILELFCKMAHELNKTVIIVTHDEYVEAIGDVVWEIRDKKILQVRTKEIFSSDNRNVSKTTNKEKNFTNNKKISKFVRWYSKEKEKRNSSKVERILIIFIALITTLASLSLNYGEAFTEGQKRFINDISDRMILVISDPYGNHIGYDYDSNVSLTDELIEEVKKIPEIDNLYPYYEFRSNGTVFENSYTASIGVKGNASKIVYEQSMFEVDNQFKIVPLYREEKVEQLLEYADSEYDSGIIISSGLADKLSSDKKSLIGKTLEINCLVPTKSFIGYETESTNNGQFNSNSKKNLLENDLYIYKVVSIQVKISGILQNGYVNTKSENKGDILLYNFDEMMKIVNANQDYQIGETFVGFKDKALSPSMLVVFAKSFSDVGIVKEKILRTSNELEVIASSVDVNALEKNISKIKSVMRMISFILILIVMILFGYVFYFKNQERKKEIGILKSIGCTRKDVVYIVSKDLLKIATKVFGKSLIFTFLIKIVDSVLYNGAGMITISIVTVLISFFLTYLIIIISGISSIWRTSNIDVIDAIRLNK